MRARLYAGSDEGERERRSARGIACVDPRTGRCRSSDTSLQSARRTAPSVSLIWSFDAAKLEHRRALNQNPPVIFEPESEMLPPEQLRELQTARLRTLLAYVKERVPLYRERLAAVEARGIASLEHLRQLPFTRKDDLRDSYPFGMLAVPREELI